jgi:hypothetical protein
MKRKKYQRLEAVVGKRCMPYSDPIKARESRRKWGLKNPKKSWASYANRDAHARAKKKGVPCDVDTNYILSIMTDTCPIYNTEFKYSHNKGVQPTSPSLDRIIPELGYTKGNVIVISMKANQIKSSANAQEIYAVAKWLEEIERNREVKTTKTD